MTLEACPAVPVPRAIAGGRAARDPACAGCSQLSLFRALRRAGLAIQGASGCDDPATPPFAAAQGAWAAVAGARAVLLAGPRRILSEAVAADARLLVLVDRDGTEARAAAQALGACAPRLDLELSDPARTEAAAQAAPAGSALVALSPCARRVRHGPPLAVAPARCNRCGACLSFGCPAIADPGGEAMSVDAAVCSGCGLCAPLCRARALASITPHRLAMTSG